MLFRTFAAGIFLGFVSIYPIVPSLAQDDQTCPGYSNHFAACEIAHRWHRVQRQAKLISKRRKIDLQPERIRDVIARRFINPPDWEKFLKANPENPDPRCVYDPKPVTWLNWQTTTEEQVVALARSDRGLSVEDLQNWNKSALLKTVTERDAMGVFKTGSNFGANLDRISSLKPIEIKNMLSIEFHDPSISLKWTNLACKDEIPKTLDIATTPMECQKIYNYAVLHANQDPFWSVTLEEMTPLSFENKMGWFWYACWPRATLNADANCGMVHYADPQKVPRELDAILNTVNAYIAAPVKSEDPLTFALRIQRWLVALHPFNKGNGRVSRWVMDFITTRLNLPPILFDNMDKDLTVSQGQLAQFARKGAEEYLYRTETCIRKFEAARNLSALEKSVCAMVTPSSSDLQCVSKAR